MPAIPNQISAVFSEDDLTKATGLVSELETLVSFALELSPDQRQRRVKAGQEDIGFVNTMFDIAKQDDTFLPKSFDVNEWSKDVALTNALGTLLNRLSPLVRKLEDTCLVASSEAYKAALVAYDNGKSNGSESIQPLLKEAGKKFKH
jgi:hypothetical protein